MRLYDYMDEKILQGVGAGVRAYNWTTGGTKADLANKFIDGTVISMISGSIAFAYYNQDKTSAAYIPAAILSPVSLILGHQNQKKNLKIEEKERKALEKKNCLDSEVEEYKKEAKKQIQNEFQSSTFCGSTGLLFSHPDLQFGIAFGGYLHIISNYIMRTDNLPPRKNVFSRAKDKVKKYLDKRKSEQVPAGLPSPSPVYAYKDLRNYISVN